jgi:hypothetical protein
MKWLLALLMTSILLTSLQSKAQFSGLKILKKFSRSNSASLDEAVQQCRVDKNYSSKVSSVAVNFKSDLKKQYFVPIRVKKKEGNLHDLEFLGEGKNHVRAVFEQDGQSYYNDKKGAGWIVNFAKAEPDKQITVHEASHIRHANHQGSDTCWYARLYEKSLNQGARVQKASLEVGQ